MLLLRVPPRWRQDEGAAIVDFVAVSALLTMLFLGVVQLALALHVRNTLVDCASEGARYGAFADRTPAEGAQRTRDLIRMSLSPRYAADVTASTATLVGMDVVEVTVVAPLPVVGLFGPGHAVTVVGHGVQG